MSTPTMKSLERRIADLEARVEELEVRAGIEDGTTYYSEEAVHEAVRQYLKHGGEL